MRTKQVRPDKTDFEFNLYISLEYNDVSKKNFILFEFNTVKVFSSFIYTINIQPKIFLDKKEISFNIEGLSAPLISLPDNGFARFEYKLYDFANTTYDLKLIKQSKEKYLYKIQIKKSAIKLIKKSSKKFVNVIIKS
jgi:hypothetical protein